MPWQLWLILIIATLGSTIYGLMRGVFHLVSEYEERETERRNK